MSGVPYDVYTWIDASISQDGQLKMTVRYCITDGVDQRYKDVSLDDLLENICYGDKPKHIFHQKPYGVK
jgi:hypothetical protein